MSKQASLSTDEHTAELEDLSPSAKLVAKTLEYEGDSTQSELAESTFLPRRTVRDALSRLEDTELVTSRISLMDARQHIYSLNPSPD